MGVDDAMTMMLWTKLFLEEQGYKIDKNILYQDNKSTILLEENGRRSAGRRSRALNIRYYFVTYQVERKNLQIQYCPTDKMTADFMSKPLQGSKFRIFRQQILGECSQMSEQRHWSENNKSQEPQKKTGRKVLSCEQKGKKNTKKISRYKQNG